MTRLLVYPEADLLALNASEGAVFDFDAHPLKLAHMSSAYAFSYDHASAADFTGELSTAAGYTAGGLALTGVTLVRTGNIITLDADDAEWTGATFGGVRWSVLYHDNGLAAALKPLIACVDWEGVVAADAGVFTVQWNAAGILRRIYPTYP